MIKITDNEAQEWVDRACKGQTTVLGCLYELHILDVTKHDDGLEFQEACDHYYSAVLSPDTVRTLIKELEELL